MDMAVNLLIRYVDRTERILWIHPSGRILMTINIDDENAWPEARSADQIQADIVAETATFTLEDPFLRLVDEEELSAAQKEVRDYWWPIIEPLINNEPDIYHAHRRWPLIKAALVQHGLKHHKYLCLMLRRCWQRGKVKNALLADYANSGGKGTQKTTSGTMLGRPRVYLEGTGINVTENIKNLFRIVIEQFYLTEKKVPLTAAFRLLIKQFFTQDVYFDNNGNPKHRLHSQDNLPTLRQFQYFLKTHYSRDVRLIKREGQNKYLREHRQVLGTSTAQVAGHGSRYQIDATIGDLYLVSRYDRNKIVGRPVIYIVIDVFTRMITGFYIGFEGPSWVSAMMALANAMSDKVAFCAELGIDITPEAWPCSGLPEVILGDRGEMAGNGVNNLIDMFGIRIENAPPYRPDWKGIVESRFDLIQQRFRPYVPGFVEPDYQERGGRDYRLDAKLDIDQFTRIFTYCVLEHNSREMHHYDRDADLLVDQVPSIPIEIWNWSIANRNGRLRHYPADLVKLALMPTTGDVSVTKSGIQFMGLDLFYSCDRAIAERWFSKARDGRWRIKVSYDPRNMNHLYIIQNGSTGYDVCPLLDRSRGFTDKTLWEIEQVTKKEKAQRASRGHGQMEIQINTDAAINRITGEAEKMTNAQLDPGMSQAARTGSIRAHRNDAKAEERQASAFDLSSEGSDQPPAQVIPLNNQPQLDFSYPKMTDQLRKKRDEMKRGKKDE